MRIVFMGTPDFAVAVLEKIIDKHEVAAVVSQPDRAKNRKGELMPTPTKQFATLHGIKTYQFDRIKNHVEELRGFNADVYVTAAYGQMLSQEIIDLPRFGIINVHASLLPKYRGSSPIQTAILNGDSETGVTIMQTSAGMDSGDILAARSVAIDNMTTGELSERLAQVGADLLLEVLNEIQCGKIKRTKQDESRVSLCKKINKEDACIDWNDDANEICRLVRAFNPNPIAYTFNGEQRIKIYAVEYVDGIGNPGEIISVCRNELVVACGSGAIKILSLQAPGKKVMSTSEFLNGNKLTIGECFGK